MFANWAQETTTTTGTGSLTLSAVTGKPRISDIVPVGERVCYAIIDASGNPVEAGVGTAAASNTLARTIVRNTYVSGTFTGANASAVSLAAGTYTVIATAVAGSFLGAGQAINSAASQRIIQSNHAQLTNGDAAALGTGNEVFYVPFSMDFGCDVDALMCQVTTLGAGNMRLGLYTVASSGKPGDKIIETADVSGGTTGIKTGTFTRRYLSPGWYYTAIASKGVAISVRAATAGSPDKMLRCTPLGMSDFDVCYAVARETLSGGWTNLPSAANTTLSYDTITSTFAPRVALRAA